MTIFMPCLVALWISVPNFNYSNVEIINDAVLADGEAEAVQEVRKKITFLASVRDVDYTLVPMPRIGILKRTGDYL